VKESIYTYVLAELQTAKGGWPDIALATGISRRTIEKIASGEIVDPGVIKIEKLARYFHGKKARQQGSAPSSTPRRSLASA
jgi:transcriptional regulator with XRE-family HTH domain